MTAAYAWSWIAGEGPIRAEVERLVAEFGVGDRVTLLGMMGDAELLSGFEKDRWHVAMLPSVVTADGEKEGIPVFLMEAMAGGVPVIATDTGGIPELLEHDAGIMVPERNAAAIADALELLRRNESLRERLVRTGRRKVHSDFSVVGSVDRLEERFAAVRSTH